MKGALLLVAVAAVVAAWYMASCALFPYANCVRCGGSGRKTSPSGKAFRNCRRCKGTGRRIRVGRRLWNWYRSDR